MERKRRGNVRDERQMPPGDGSDPLDGFRDDVIVLPPGGMDDPELRERLAREIAEEIIKMTDARRIAHKYIVGVYQSSGYHLETLHTIHSYYRRAAEQGDPIAQYHLALFLRYLGEFVIAEEDRDEIENKADEWLNKAMMTELAGKRVEELNKEFVAEVKRAGSRQKAMLNKIDTLVKIEDEKIDMIHEVLIKIAARAKQVDNMAERERAREERLAKAKMAAMAEILRPPPTIVVVPPR
jgi:hypothetical protein